jgi:aryl-alcohol dehydrogenase-like predicted oxidoreductase
MALNLNEPPRPINGGSRVGLGCMGMSEFYGSCDETSALKALHTAWDLGYRHFDTADMYGSGANEQLIGRFFGELGERSSAALLATKVGIRRVPGTVPSIEIDSSPVYLSAACERSLKRLRVERIGLLYLHRKSPEIPIEDSVGALQQLVEQGKVARIGLSEVSCATLERACRVAPIAALQSEYSLWSRDVEDGILDLCRELEVALVAYSPLGRGFLTGQWQAAPAGQGAPDLRSFLPRFQAGNVEANQGLLHVLRDVGQELGCLPAQAALAWVLGGGEHVHAIPGSTREANLATNFAARAVRLSPEQRDRLGHAFRAGAVAGARYPAALLATVNV